MPIVVDPGFAWPPEVDPVVSPDGRLTAVVDPAHAGVLLRADFDDSVPDIPALPEVVHRTNLALDPSFETGIGDWKVRWGNRVEPLTRTTNSWAIASGVYALQIDGTDTPNAAGSWIYVDLDVTGGEWVALAANMRHASATPVSAQFVMYSYDSGGGILASDFSNESHALNANQNSYASSRYQFGSSQAPLGAVSARVGVFIRGVDGSSDPPPNFTAHMDDASVACATTRESAELAVATYFDGDTAASGDKHYRYAEDGTSEEYTPGSPFIPGHDATVAKVRFERQDGTIVRSGNPAWAPGGYAHAYDHEATLGGGTLWRAVPIHFDGTEGTPSEYVGAVIPPLSDGWAWLKPVTDPDKAMKLKVEPINQEYDGRLDTTSIAGAGTPAATWDVLEGFTGQLRALIREKTVQDKFMELLDLGPVLVQFPPCAGVPDFYCLREKVSIDEEFWDGYPVRRYTVPIVSVARPDTTDSPLRIPGLSYDTVARDWTTYDQLRSTVDSYNKLLEP